MKKDGKLWLDIVSWAIKNSYHYCIESCGNGNFHLTCRSLILDYRAKAYGNTEDIVVTSFYNPNEFTF